MTSKWIYGWMIVCTCLMIGCSTSVPEKKVQVVACASMPESRTSAAAFSYQGKGYIFGGRNSQNKLTNTLFCYDAATDSWVLIGNAPMDQRVSAVACEVDGIVYMGLGLRGHVFIDSAYCKDWWSWDITKNEWKQLASYPNARTINAAAYCENGKIYCVHGFGQGFTTDIFCYDIATNTWQEIPRPQDQEAACMAGCGTMCNGQWFYGGGYNTYTLDQWIELRSDGSIIYKQALPTKLCMAAAASDGQVVIVVGGRYFAGTLTGGEVRKDIWVYDPKTNSWTWGGLIGDAGESRAAVTINGKMYVGLGNDDEQILKTWYKIEP